MNMRVAVTALAGFAALAAFIPGAEAANRFSLLCLQNQTNATITYSFKWGEKGNWSSRTLGPNAGRSHFYKYDRPNESKSPWMYVRFDSDTSSRMLKQDYRLTGYASPQESDCKAYGKEYVFRYDGTARKYIDLKAIR